jgi:molecular chaperone DnaJ
VNEDTEFQREGINILSQIRVSYLQAVLGCQLSVNTVDGMEELSIPSGIQPGTTLTLEGKGVPRLGNPVSRGDHLITIQVEIPQRVSPEERKLLEELAKIRGDQVGKGKEGFLGSIFGGGR